MVFDGARQGDAECSRIVAEIADHLARGLASIFMLLLPDRVLLTGGVTHSFDLLAGPLRRSLEKYNVIIPAASVDIRLADLGQKAGIFGAARAAHLLLDR
jgi:glucokinase